MDGNYYITAYDLVTQHRIYTNDEVLTMVVDPLTR